MRLLGLKPSDSSALARAVDVTEKVLSNPEPIVVNGLFVAQDSVLQEAATASINKGEPTRQSGGHSRRAESRTGSEVAGRIAAPFPGADCRP